MNTRTFFVLGLILNGPANIPLAVSLSKSCLCKMLSSRNCVLQSNFEMSWIISGVRIWMPCVNVDKEGALGLRPRNFLI